jgi:hypothetical protein
LRFARSGYRRAMALAAGPLSDFEASAVIEAAAREGFELVHFESSAGATIWEWRRKAEPRPQFVTRRVALAWMYELLSRGAAAPAR